MRPHRLFPLLLLAVLAVAGGASSARAHGSCTQRTNAYFFTTDTQDLSRGLAANLASCTDYWISVTPYTAAGPNFGKPKGSPALPVVHAQGTQFHALAEIRLKAWCGTVADGNWEATGQMLHHWMVANEGYDPSRDTWAINEIGTPSDAVCQDNVFANAPGARRNFVEFVHGLYEGLPGDTPMAGVVFAATPIQMAPDLADYERGLASWYADTPFWEAMNQYVAVWAQEGYADARAWGIDGASADDRAAALNAYSLHAQKLAANYPVVRDFFTRAYTPFGNASYRYGIPAVGPFPGYTDIGYPSLFNNFVSAQVYARRSSAPNRFGFDVAPKDTGGASIRQGIEAHLGAAIRDSQDDPLGACTATGESCDGAVPGAFFPATWPNFATPPIVTAHVAGPQADDGWYTGDVSVSWDVSDPETGVDTSTGCDSVTVTQDTAALTFTCTATSSGGSTTRTVTIRRDTTPPVIVPRISGTLGANGWYVGDVTVSWDVTDSLSPVRTTTGCDTMTIAQDTSGALVACTATSDGGTSSKSVLIQRDTTAPSVTCSATPAALWPPNGKLVPVQVSVEVADATSGAAGYVLSAAPEGWDIGSPDVAGFLRATKDALYTLTYTASDAAGNTATCDAHVTVPHDQGRSAGTP